MLLGSSASSKLLFGPTKQAAVIRHDRGRSASWSPAARFFQPVVVYNDIKQMPDLRFPLQVRPMSLIASSSCLRIPGLLAKLSRLYKAC